jgi:hypothetical protein
VGASDADIVVYPVLVTDGRFSAWEVSAKNKQIVGSHKL